MIHIETVLDYQIFQQTDGFADIPVRGTVRFEEKTLENIMLLLLREDDSTLVTAPVIVPIVSDGTFSATIHAPTGGHYTLLCSLCNQVFADDLTSATDWPDAGHGAIPSTAIYHIGVGEIFLIAGQSNASGVGKTPGFDPPHPLVHLCRNSLTWTTAAHPTNDATDTSHPENADFYLPGTSPYLRFGTTMCRALGCPIGLIAVSKGDTYLGQWLPESDETQAQYPLSDCYSTGSLWHVVEMAVAAVGGRIAGVAWYQGENDADDDAMCTAYAERFARFVGHVRTLCRDSALPFFTVQINKATDGRTTDVHCGMMREAQRQAAHRIPRVFVVPAHDLPMSDAVHNNTAANGVIGERLAWSALENVYGKPYFGKAPDATAAKRELNGKEMRIRVTFENVIMGLVDFGCTAQLCHLRTANGTSLPIHRAICKGSELILDTAPCDGTLYFDFATDSLPAVPVSPIDRGTGMPPLGVYGLPVA